MLITESMAEQVRIKRAVNRLTMKELAQKLGTTYSTLRQVEHGDYGAPRRIYQSVSEWLAEDY